MFKPNIRGFPRSKLRFALKGWRVVGEVNKLIVYRLPWRKSWIAQLQSHPTGAPMISRNGAVYLVQDTQGVQKGSKIWFLGAFMLLVFAAALWVASLGADSNSQKVSALPGATTRPQLSCQQLLGNPTLLLDSNSPLQEQIPEQEVQTLGGVRSSVIAVECDSKVQKFRITKVRVAGQWNIAKAAQLNK